MLSVKIDSLGHERQERQHDHDKYHECHNQIDGFLQLWSFGSWILDGVHSDLGLFTGEYDQPEDIWSVSDDGTSVDDVVWTQWVCLSIKLQITLEIIKIQVWVFNGDRTGEVLQPSGTVDHFGDRGDRILGFQIGFTV
ncbi:hypothetical protein WICPIJ_009381 [Wickerhamomyces pijperi]|uniref:Uncharacterized protein n=1 Tax=Wickerhamomyces pijperi TaxID=599730 RepID=A0A9P8PNX8_WICPI|nr:hypothetical protein WICPIJ_009381 [Wickerhamomyces pijperi]